jgi:hypothetical protein
MTDQDQLAKIADNTNKLLEIVTGGENIRNGLVFRLEEIERHYAESDRRYNERQAVDREAIERMAVRITTGEHKSDDMEKRMNTVEKSIIATEANTKWIKWGVLAAAAAAGSGTGLQLAGKAGELAPVVIPLLQWAGIL